MRIPFSDLSISDLHVDAVYESGRGGNAGDDPFPRLLRMSNQGGFRFRGELSGDLEMVLLTTTMADPDWPDSLDPETGVFTYYGDNKSPGNPLHQTGRGGNELLRRLFGFAHQDRAQVPPVFLFARAGSWRDARFLGLAVPGASDLTLSEDLVAVWRTVAGLRFQNYRARFTVLNAPVVKREWIESIVSRRPDPTLAPQAWQNWRTSGHRDALRSPRSIEHRSRAEQNPPDSEGVQVMEVIRQHFQGRPHAFEHFAAAIAQLMLPNIAEIDVTRPSRDGGRDATGKLRIGDGPGSILVDFALEAKCYSPPKSVGVREMSRLISRLRHRQFGILVTSTWVDPYAYREITEDQHPIVIISAADIVRVLKQSGQSGPQQVAAWLETEFPPAGGLEVSRRSVLPT